MPSAFCPLTFDMPKRILVLQTAFLGDVLLITPLLRAIREAMSEVQISALVIPVAEGVLSTNPFVDNVIVYDKRRVDRGPGGIWHIIRTVRGREFDVAIVSHRSVRSAGIVWGSGIPMRIGFDRSAGAFLFTDIVRYRPDLHEIRRNLSLLQPFGLTPDPSRPEVFPTEDDHARALELLVASGIADEERPVALAPGSAWPTKRWPSEGFAEVANRAIAAGRKVVLIGGWEDRALCEQIAQQTIRPPAIMAGALTVRGSSALLSRCAVLVSNDSAAAHLGTAVGVPTVTVFGPTVPAFGFTPYGEGHAIVEEEVSCRPCGAHGGERCPKTHFRCMRTISPARVFAEMMCAIERNG